MKPIIAATACFITATVVCAHISDGTESSSTEAKQQPIVSYIQNAYTDSTSGNMEPSAYGLVGAAALTLVIAARRIGAQLQS
ncbi:hypothetical protein [Pelagicoccus sp. SDUM812003]|uniref:hypothetical protein n=1 Tax=Pelagicoccus sp. SDUM812003 TaxID=3041267 RepID=UPI00280D4404|nr:hypothetical protein [Pelagicoccus sp. SDUM812003]MDQ8203679.1 hypothetical protein [Pelagicoccus sp. SDUM812003]